MPLWKLRLKEEQARATPELCRQAPKDDPRALLAAANVSDLVGVVRTLAELSDYAAVIFHQLHKETVDLGARGDALAARLKTLEESTPEAELRVFTESNTPQLLSNPGIHWRAHSPIDQNLFTHSELPPYVGKAYANARPPPPLDVLDRFDRTAEAGGALRRYTDPSYFKREWALAELAQAEREKKARKAKRKAKHQAERRNSHDLHEAADAKPPSRSRRISGTFAAAASETRNPPLVALSTPQRLSVYIPNEAQPSSPGDSHRNADAPSGLATPATQGTISPYVESSVASPQEDGRVREWGLGQDRAGLASVTGDTGIEGALVDERGDGLCEVELPRVIETENGEELSESRPVVEQSSSWTMDQRKGNSKDVVAKLPAVTAGLPAVVGVAHSLSQPESAVLGLPDADEGMHPREEVREQPIPRARRRTARGALVAGAVQKSDGEGESRFPRAESFDSVKQAERVREQLEKEANLAARAPENGRTGSSEAEPIKDLDLLFRGDVDANVPAVEAELPPQLETEHIDRARDFEGVWDPAHAAGVQLADAVTAGPADENHDPDVTADVSCSILGKEPKNDRLSDEGSSAGEDSAPGSPLHPGLQKLQLEYQKAQARLEALLCMQRELEEQASLSGGVPNGGSLMNGVNENPGAVPSVASLAVELSRSSLGGQTEGMEPGHESPPRTVDIDSPAWSTLSSPLHAPLVPHYPKSPGLPGRREWTVLDSPGPCGRRLPATGSSIHMSPPRDTSPGGFSSSPSSSPEPLSPLRQPWSLAGPQPDFSPEYHLIQLSAETSLHANGKVTTGVAPVPPAKPLPKPPPPPPLGSLAVFRKPPPPPPPLAPGALTISGPSSSRGGAANLMQAIAQHDKGKLKRVDVGNPGGAAPAADRNIMLEQIKRGVNLRRTEPVKAEEKPSRSAVDINVASILERANAIRQAMQDSDDDDDDDDEDDDWSD